MSNSFGEDGVYAKQRRPSGKLEGVSVLVGKGERRESEEGISLVLGAGRDRDDQNSGDQCAQPLAHDPTLQECIRIAWQAMVEAPVLRRCCGLLLRLALASAWGEGIRSQPCVLGNCPHTHASARVR